MTHTRTAAAAGQGKTGLLMRVRGGQILCGLLWLLLSFGASAAPDHPASYEEWSRHVSHAIQMNMLTPRQVLLSDETQPLTTVLVLVLGQNGAIHRLKVEQSSGNAAVDEAALNAVWRTRRLPPFSPDMKGPELTLRLPLTFRVDRVAAGNPPLVPPASSHRTRPALTPASQVQPVRKEPQKRIYEDAASGLRVEVPVPLEPRASKRPRRRYDALIDVISTSGLPPMIDNSPSLCTVGLMARQANEVVKPAALNDSSALDTMAFWARALFGVVGKVESETRFTHQGTGGVELIVAPGSGPGHAYQRIYVAVQEYPRGRVVVSCGTHVDAMAGALTAFRTVRDGVMLPDR